MNIIIKALLFSLEIQCQPPVQNPNIESVTPDQTSYDVGAEVTFVCRDGFDLVGSETSVCQNDESWSPREPTCKKSKTELVKLLR